MKKYEELRRLTPDSTERMIWTMESNDFTIECSCYTYITLKWNGKFIFCLDNDIMRAEEMIYKIEKRTGLDFQNIPIKGSKDDFNGLRFFNGGWKRNFWDDFPSKKEVDGYMKLRCGKV